MPKFYITTAIPYVNGRPHIGHTLEYFQADAIKKYRQLLGDETLLLSGADENALKNVQAAEKEGLPIKEFLDKYSKIWKDTYGIVGVKLDVFQRGSDEEKHWPGVQKLWKLCEESGDIYKKSYQGLYCVGCEAFKLESELVDGLCSIHRTKPEEISEENYFFRLSKYQEKLIKLIESNTLQIIPSNKRAEALSFIKQGLEDFSVSRSNERAKGVGVPVPGDPNQKIYVWFDALTIYMTGIGFGADEKKWKYWWPADVHVIGKDINRFHTVYWPAMLLSARFPLPKQILIHGFVNAKGGEKFSKSLGNAPDPKEVIDKYGVEAVRYYMLAQVPIDSDHDFTYDRFEEVYNADLANGLGNLVARVAKLCEKIKLNTLPKPKLSESYKQKFEQYKFNEQLVEIWARISEIDREIEKAKPWEIDDLNKLQGLLQNWVEEINQIALDLKPFLPNTSKKIQKLFVQPKIQPIPPLFPRIQ
ncbi:MAG: methionine--tRNA ligase [Candidatus Levybacteria bacterium]|nr:methionine--tRNA ligase [Candidatus Levybacteria bacterium]